LLLSFCRWKAFHYSHFGSKTSNFLPFRIY
jgi:hypothetical protein